MNGHGQMAIVINRLAELIFSSAGAATLMGDPRMTRSVVEQ
jgi:hypothetical protein